MSKRVSERPRPPCVRNIARFPDGCPERTWDGHDGCPLWHEQMVAPLGAPTSPVLKKQCIDRWMFDVAWSTLAAVEGNQAAVESFRNGMVSADGVPKPDHGMMVFLKLVREVLKQKQLATSVMVENMLADARSVE